MQTKPEPPLGVVRHYAEVKSKFLNLHSHNQRRSQETTPNVGKIYIKDYHSKFISY